MILFIHIIIAISGLAIATLAFAKSSNNSLIFSKLLAVLTLISGVFLTIQSSASLVKTCTVGVAYFGLILVLNHNTSKKLADS